MTPEFSRPERVDTIGDRERQVTVSADEGERRRLAARFGIVAVERLDATFDLRRDAAGVVARGRVTAAVVQACSVTDVPLAQAIDEAVELRFVEDAVGDGDEVELAADSLDTMSVEHGAIDLGEAAAETMALALDAFPRAPGAAAALREAGVIGDDEVTPSGPLAGLAALLKKD